MIFDMTAGAGEPYKVPVLNNAYPEDLTVDFDAEVTCKVEVATHGKPEQYTYQWYKNGSAVEGATEDSYTFSPDVIGTVTVECDVTNAAGTVTSRTATITGTVTYFFNAGAFNSRLCPSGVYMTDSKYTYISGDLLHMSNWGSVKSNDAIDFTKFKTVTLQVNRSYDAWIELRILDGSGNVVSQVSSHDGVQGSNATATLDVSDINQSYYLELKQVSNYAYTDHAHNLDITSVAFT